MVVWGKQALVGVVGFGLALAMIWLGLWQMQVFESKENSSAVARAAQPAVWLLDFVGDDGTVGDSYGKTVWVSGVYLPAEQVLIVGTDGTLRVLTALQLADGRVLPVVRGAVDSMTATVPPPPAGTVTQTGVFLPSEASAAHTVPADAMGSVRLPLLAQRWSQPLLPGFITLGRVDAVAQGLSPATPALPTGEGSVQNIGYALQWWAFAAFAVLLTFRIVGTIGRHGDLGTLSEQEDV
ncbi:MAG: SURF1 family protein [Propionicimonas sp.]